MNELPDLAELEAATTIVRPWVPPTPQFSWPLLNARAGLEVWVKHENHTPVGSFKARGALVYFDRLWRTRPALTGVVAATRGNFGQAVTFAARRNGLRAVIVVPQGNSADKNAAMRALGAELVEHGADFQAAFEHAQELAATQSLHFVPSFDRQLVAGAGTYALEFLRGAPPLDAIYVPVGLGSGICAMCAARNALGLPVKIIGAVSAQAPAYARSFAARQVVTHAVTTRIADGVAIRQPDARAVALIARHVERFVTVTDDEVEAAMRVLFSDTHNTAEGAGAVALAALWQERAQWSGRRVGIVLTGGNVDRPVFARVLAVP
jgi:threonine dehydratase